MQIRKIIHIDMDAYFAAVEQRDNPDLKGKPVVVGGRPDSRGVVATCSYEARKFGIHSAMPSSTAFRLCPDAIFVRPRIDAYKKITEQVHEIFHEYTDIIEPLSLDEAYLDVTENKKGISSATIIAREIKKKIFKKTGITASAGVSYNKFIAKVASDYNKPDGITVIPPEKADQFIEILPIGKFYGVGKVTEKKMIDLGIKTGKDLKKISKNDLIKYFGKPGLYYYYIARGIDLSPVNPERIQKSIGREVTFSEDITDMKLIIKILSDISENVEKILKKNSKNGYTITLKVKYFDFKSVTRSVTLHEAVCQSTEIMKHIKGLIMKTEAGNKKVRLLGITVSNFEKPDLTPQNDQQLNLPF